MGLPSMRPTGWFQVAWSADLEVGDVKPLHYFGEDLVAFRDLNGAVRVLDAHCRHLGADLSHGGCVVEGGIQCPFHGWVWSGADGRNVRIPYEQCPVDDQAGAVLARRRTQRMHLRLARDQAVRPALAGAGHVPRARAIRSGEHCFRPVGPDEKQFFARDCGASAIGRREHRRRPALPVRASCPAEPDRPCRGLERPPRGTPSWRSAAAIPLKYGGTASVWASTVRTTATEGRSSPICPTPVDDSHHRHLRDYWVSEDLDYDDRLLRGQADAGRRHRDLGTSAIPGRPCAGAVGGRGLQAFARMGQRLHPSAQPDLRSVTL